MIFQDDSTSTIKDENNYNTTAISNYSVSKMVLIVIMMISKTAKICYSQKTIRKNKLYYIY
jgi:hypothetical protein